VPPSARLLLVVFRVVLCAFPLSATWWSVGDRGKGWDSVRAGNPEHSCLQTTICLEDVELSGGRCPHTFLLGYLSFFLMVTIFRHQLGAANAPP